MNRLAGIISHVFHPLYMPLIGMAIVLNGNDIYRMIVPPALAWFIYLVFLVFTLLFPVFSIVGLRIAKVVNSIHLPTRQERRIPLLLGTTFFMMAYWLIRSVNEIMAINFIMVAGVFTMVLLLILNNFIKLSVHMAGIGGVTGMLTAVAGTLTLNSDWYLVGAVLAAGLTGFARLQLKAHSVSEVVLGYVVGFFSQYVLLNYLIHRAYFL